MESLDFRNKDFPVELHPNARFGVDWNDKNVDDPNSFTHRFAQINGIRIHFVEEGQGPLVILLHGIPYLWYTWRRQIRALATAGYRVIAPDIRGFGQSDCPSDVQNYGLFYSVGDLVGLMEELGESTAVIVGHDLGAWVANAAIQLRPDLFRALVMLNTPVGPREVLRPSVSWEKLRIATGKRGHHDYFQNPHVDQVLNADIRKTLRSILYSVSGRAIGEERWNPLIGEGETLLDTLLNPIQLPDWLSDGVLDYYVSEYSRNGFTPMLNHYRNRDRNWEQMAFLEGVKQQQPAMFIGGADDVLAPFFMPIFDKLENFMPNMQTKVLLKGVGHDAPEEQPNVVTSMLLEFLQNLD